MIINILLTIFCLLFGYIFITFFSSGIPFDPKFIFSDLILLLALLVLLCISLVFSGHMKMFLKIFSSDKKFKNFDLNLLTEINNSIKFASKILFFESALIIFIGSVHSFANYLNNLALSSNLSFILLTFRYLCAIETVFVVINGAVKKLIASKTSAKNSSDEKAELIEQKISKFLIKPFISIVLIIVATIFIIKNYTVDNSDLKFGLIATWLDIPSVFAMIFCLVPIIFCNKFYSDLSISISTLRNLIFLSGLFLMSIGIFDTFIYLDEKSSFGLFMHCSTLPCIYATVLAVFLLFVESTGFRENPS